eukprot:12365951-Ditylum_brightwellii.AAC.1
MVNENCHVSVSESSQNSTKIYAGLGTSLKPVEPTTRAPIGSGNLEKFLHHFESTLLEANNGKILQDRSIVVVPIDKTNNYVTVTVEKFHSWVLGHLSENAEELDRKMIIYIHRKAEFYAAKLKPMLAEGEMNFLNEGIASKAIPQP